MTVYFAHAMGTDVVNNIAYSGEVEDSVVIVSMVNDRTRSVLVECTEVESDVGGTCAGVKHCHC